MAATRRAPRVPTAVWIVAALSAACGRPEPPSALARAAADAGSSASTPIDAGPPLVLDDLWALAREGDDLDLSRLARREGPASLARALDVPEARPTALRALACADGPPEIAPLARVAAKGDAADAAKALDTLLILAARPRRAEEIEDVDLLREGILALLALARDPASRRERRVPAIGALRMFADAGMLRREEIPTDLDAK